MNDFRHPQPTLCWDCANATGKCSWSSDLKPVKGWTAVPTKKYVYGGYMESYLVSECPQFKRDAIGAGMKKYKELEAEGDNYGTKISSTNN